MSGAEPPRGTGLPRGALLVLLGCCVCQLGLGCAYVFGATLKHIVSEFEWSRAAYAGSSLPLLLGYALAAPVVGTLYERIGVRALLGGAVLLLAASFVLFARMQSLWSFYAISFLLGVALTGVGDVPVGAVATRWVARGRGLALGLVYSGSNLGGAAVPILVTAVAAQSSWREALLILAGAAVVIILPFAVGVVREPPAGYRAPGEEPAPEPAAGPAEKPELDLAEALATRSFWLLVATLFFFYFYYLAVNQHLIAYLGDRGYSDARAAASFGSAVGLGIAAKLGMGVMADRIATLRALRLNLAALLLASLLLLLADRPAVLPLFLLLHGLATAAENVILPLVVAECFGVRHLARVYGALMVTLLPGGALGPIFAGAVFDSSGDYRQAFVVFALGNGLALLAASGLRCERGRAAQPGRVIA